MDLEVKNIKKIILLNEGKIMRIEFDDGTITSLEIEIEKIERLGFNWKNPNNNRIMSEELK